MVPGAQWDTHPASRTPASAKQVQPWPGASASILLASATCSGESRKKMAWWTTAVFNGWNCAPVRNPLPCVPGSMRKHR